MLDALRESALTLRATRAPAPEANVLREDPALYGASKKDER